MYDNIQPASSGLTRQIQSQGYQGQAVGRTPLGPYVVLRSLIETRLRDNKPKSEALYKWITFQSDEAKRTPKVSAFPIDVASSCGRLYLDATPALNALMVWSRMKFHVMCTTNIDDELKDLLVSFIRDIELTLKNGVKYHLIGDRCTISSMSYDEFCEFALTALF